MAKPVAGVEIGLVDGILTVNPTKAEMSLSTLQLTVAGTKDGILMIEGAANFLPEEVMVEAYSESNLKWFGRTGDNKTLNFTGPVRDGNSLIGSYLPVLVTRAGPNSLQGEWVSAV